MITLKRLPVVVLSVASIRILSNLTDNSLDFHELTEIVAIDYNWL